MDNIGSWLRKLFRREGEKQIAREVIRRHRKVILAAYDEAREQGFDEHGACLRACERLVCHVM